MYQKFISLLIVFCMLFASLANSAVLVLAPAEQQDGTGSTISCHENGQIAKQADTSTPVHATGIAAKMLHDCCSGIAPFLLSAQFIWPDQQLMHVKAMEPVLILTLRPERLYRPPRFFS